MSFLSKLVKVGLNIVETPIAIVKDTVTLGGVLTDRDTTYTEEKLEELEDDYEDMKDEL